MDIILLPDGSRLCACGGQLRPRGASCWKCYMRAYRATPKGRAVARAYKPKRTDETRERNRLRMRRVRAERRALLGFVGPESSPSDSDDKRKLG